VFRDQVPGEAKAHREAREGREEKIENGTWLGLVAFLGRIGMFGFP